jgi:hypothetical protein
MTPNRILFLNAASTGACAVAMLAFRGTLHQLFGLDSPVFFDVLAVGLLVYAGALVAAARQPRVERRALMAFTAADGLWVAASVIVLLLFWGQWTPIGRVLVVGVAAVVEVFATLQYRAAGRVGEPA